MKLTQIDVNFDVSFELPKDIEWFSIRNPKVLQLSNDSHLYKEKILKGYQGWIDL